MTVYGDITDYAWCIAISSTETAGAPSGDVIYMLCKTVDFKFASKMKLKQYAAGYSFSNRDGKRDDAIAIGNAVVVKYSTNNLSESFEKILYRMKQFTKMSASPCYLWVKNWTDSQYLGIGQNSALTSQYDYMKGYPINLNGRMEKGHYVFSSIQFRECLT